MTTFGERKLVRESEWMRVFQQTEENTYLYESKFLVDDLEVPAAGLKERWPDFSGDEKIEFALAFGCHTLREGNDREILDFLMAVGPEEVWRLIAIVVASHPQGDAAMKFLLERIRKSGGPYANYYQSIELLHRKEAIPLLRQRYDEYRKAFASKPKTSDGDTRWTDYLQCAKALWTLTYDSTYIAALREVPIQVQSYATRLLREIDEAKEKDRR
jgi:hypothetical protein